MSDIELNLQLGAEPRFRTGGITSRRQTGVNQKLSWAIITLLALVPLPFGSVHGFSWGFFAAYTGLMATVYGAALIRIGEPLRYPLDALRVPAVLFAVMIAFLIAQMLPIGLLTGPATLVQSSTASVISNSVSIATDMTFLMLVRQITYGLFFVLVLQVTYNDTRRRLLIDALLIIIAFYGVMAIISLQMGDTVLGVDKSAYIGSATGPFVNRNSFATFLGFGAVIALAQIGRRIVDQIERHPHDGLVSGNISTIVLYAIAYVLLISVIVATQSRMGLAACIGGSLVVAAIIVTRSVQSRRALIYILGTAAVAGISSLFLFGDAMFDRMFDIERSSIDRMDLYAQVIDMIAQRPLTGYGGGSFELAFSLVHQAPVDINYVWDKAHNTYLTLWSELGIVFGSLPILLLGFVAVRLAMSLRSGNASWTAQTIALGVLVMVGIHSLVDFSLEIQANTFVFVTVIAAGLSAARQIARE